jgi:UV DNA damage endonuclease
MRPGLCCICLALKDLERPLSLQTMTFKSFSSMERVRALEVLGGRILNNMEVTLASLRYCGERNFCYRLSSDLFPLITYDRAGVGVEDLPQHGLICRTMDGIRSYISDTGVRVSTHPDQFNVLASENEESLARTVRELNFQSWFMDRIGCPADHRSPINLHVNSNKGSRDSVVDRLLRGMDMLDDNCRRRLVFENDDKQSSWSVRLLLLHMHGRTGTPLTFDYLHHKCHPDGLSEDEALALCHATWGGMTPLFHYSESRDEKNPRAHADFPSKKPETYGLDFDLDFEFKEKDRAIALFESTLLEPAA